MSLIIKDKIQALMAGYPTVSDKYNVSGGILSGSNAVKFGELVQKTTTPGYFKKAVSLSAVTDVVGFALATNVKLAEGFASDVVQINVGEAFNLLVNGFLAVELDDDATIETVTAIAAVGALTQDASPVTGKTYYTRASSSAGAGYLNDGTYAYTAVASPSSASMASYYELSVLGRDAATDQATANAKCCVILSTGKITTYDKASSGTIVELPNVVFTGFKEMHGSKKIAEMYVK